MARIVEVEWIHFESISSTSSWIKEHIGSLDPNICTCVLAELQTKGYGRNRREWVSQKGNLHLSFHFGLEKGDSRLPNLGQILSVACLRILPTRAKIKWPNDILIDEKKCAGILVELADEKDHVAVIAGLGLNVFSPVETDQEAIALCEVEKVDENLEDIAQTIVQSFFEFLEGGFAPLLEIYEAHLAHVGLPITFTHNQKTLRGTLKRVTPEGHLQITTPEGELLTFSSGEINQLRRI